MLVLGEEGEVCVVELLVLEILLLVVADEVRKQLPPASRRLVPLLELFLDDIGYCLVEGAPFLLRLVRVASGIRTLHNRLCSGEDFPSRLLEEVLMQLLGDTERVLLLTEREGSIVVDLVLVSSPLLAFDDVVPLSQLTALGFEVGREVIVRALIHVVVPPQRAALDLVLLDDLHVRVLAGHLVDQEDRIVDVVVVLLLDLEDPYLAIHVVYDHCFRLLLLLLSFLVAYLVHIDYSVGLVVIDDSKNVRFIAIRLD